MPVYRLGPEPLFPPPSEAEPEGLLAVGGDLSPERLLEAYARGIFPWFDELPILWFSPDPRYVLRPEDARVGRSLRRALARAPFDIAFDRDFESVVRACAETPRPEQEGTWITPDMVAAYTELHRRGFAHCVSAYAGGELVGGLYGVSLGAAFFGESMFAHQPDASKIAFVYLCRQLVTWGFHFVDCQVETPHLVRFGAEPWPRPRFLDALERALAEPTRRGSWSAAAGAAEA
ncbi:MAG: leucyl/phenylalanyl-tRNA--protein transferase [Proteobacteria bacterium]|nr:leucyl/phenylalanyl-tRNA--protein transferase [Pseudomonadota bacterium]